MKYFQMNILLIALIYSLFTGCATTNLTLTTNTSLPTPSNIKYIAESNKIAIEWQPIYENIIDGYIIYKQNQQGEFKTHKIIYSRFMSHYIDTKLDYNSIYKYKLSSFNKLTQKESPLSRIETMKTAPKIPAVSYIKPIILPENKIKIIFRPHKNKKVKAYIIKRTNDTKNLKWQKEFYIKDRLSAEFIDHKLTPNTKYLYQIEAITYDDLVSYPSKIVSIHTNPLPTIVKNIKASTNLKDKINIYWKANPRKENISYYNIYQKGLLGIKLIAKTKGTKYQHKVSPNSQYKYIITATNIHNLESLPPFKPVIGSTTEIKE